MASWASTPKVILGCIAFAVFWILAVFPAVPLLPIGRTAGCLLGGVLMVVFGVLSPSQAYAAVDLPILGLLFGTMVVSIYLQRADLFKYLASILSWKSKGAKDLLCRLSILSAISSALFTNDTTCVVFTEFALTLCKQKGFAPQPFLMALATSSNIGSAATAIGNPQNLVIAVQSNIPFFKFLIGLLPAMLVGILVNTVLLLLFYWRTLSPNLQQTIVEEQINVEDPKSQLPSGGNAAEVPAANAMGSDDDNDSWHSPAMIDELLYLEPIHSRSNSRQTEEMGDQLQQQLSPTIQRSNNRIRRRLWKICVYLVTLGMLAALLCGLNLSWSTMTAAVALIVLDFVDAGPSLDQVSYSLLVFFSGMFITVEGFDKTGVPGKLWDAVEPSVRISRASGIILLSVVVILLSNVASNVPTVLLLGTRVASSAAATPGASVTKAWLMLAWVSTVAGNLTLVGSAANLIVSEQARRADPCLRYNLSFWGHLKFGLPATFVVIAVGLPLITI